MSLNPAEIWKMIPKAMQRRIKHATIVGSIAATTVLIGDLLNRHGHERHAPKAPPRPYPQNDAPGTRIHHAHYQGRQHAGYGQSTAIVAAARQSAAPFTTLSSASRRGAAGTRLEPTGLLWEYHGVRGQSLSAAGAGLSWGVTGLL
jgi:hypothetical protein